jgi:integrase
MIEERIGKDGTVTYRVKVRLKGHPSQSASFARKTDAKRWETQTEAAIREGRHFHSAKARQQTVADLIDRYIKNVIPTKGSQASHQKAQLEWWRSHIGAYALSQVSPALLGEHRDMLLDTETSRGDTYSPSTVNRYIAALSHCFTYAVQELEWLENNPVSRMRKPTEADGRVRWLDDDERERLFDACRQSRERFLYPYVFLAVSTGMRQSEILNLYWSAPKNPPDEGAWGIVHVESDKIILHKTKNKKRRAVPLSDMAIEELKKIQETTGLVFPGKKDSDRPMHMRTAFENAVEAAGIADFRFHDTRHTFASYLVMSGASLAEAAEMLGHKTLAMVQRYAHLSDAHISGVSKRMIEMFIRRDS